MADETVTVQVLQDHTSLGKSYRVGQTYQAPADLVETLRVQGKASRVDPVARKAKKAGKTTKAPKVSPKVGASVKKR